MSPFQSRNFRIHLFTPFFICFSPRWNRKHFGLNRDREAHCFRKMEYQPRPANFHAYFLIYIISRDQVL